jgi:cell division septation protein DedD
MAKSGGGEFEVLLGNKQLLSLFFIVVILLAVFFTMGYVLGRSTGSAGAPAIASQKTEPETAARTPSGFPNTYSGTELPASPAPSKPPQSTVPQSTAPQPAAPQSAPVTTQPARAAPPAAGTKPPAPEPVPSVTPTQPVAGQTYLQVHAGARSETELFVSVLQKQGFPILIAPGPSAGVYRALVGPFADEKAAAKSRVELEKAGFKPFPRKY